VKRGGGPICTVLYIKNVHTWNTAGIVGVALVADDALASGQMVAHNAVGVGRTRARVHTLLVAARQHLGTVVVHCALGPAAGGVGVAQVAGRTDAARLVILGFADGAGSTLLVDTGVLTGA
jgi:hypothetical protein